MSMFPNTNGFYFKLFKVIRIQLILVLNIVLFCLKQTEFDFFGGRGLGGGVAVVVS